MIRIKDNSYFLVTHLLLSIYFSFWRYIL